MYVDFILRRLSKSHRFHSQQHHSQIQQTRYSLTDYKGGGWGMPLAGEDNLVLNTIPDDHKITTDITTQKGKPLTITYILNWDGYDYLYWNTWYRSKAQ